MTGFAEQRLRELNIILPEPGKPVANYLPWVIEGNILTISGQLPFKEDGKLLFTGIVEREINAEHAGQAAGQCFINVLAQVKVALGGDFGRIKRLIRLGGFIASPAGFTGQAAIMNGASDLAIAILGEAGRHTRSTVGVVALPLNAPVEVEATFSLQD